MVVPRETTGKNNEPKKDSTAQSPSQAGPTMSQVTAVLEEELGISSEATLRVPSQLIIPIHLVFISQSAVENDFVTIASPSPCSPDDIGPGCLSTTLSMESSMRGDAARCLVVGRQASASDIRIDHKSVSRRHTVFYYKHSNGGDDAMLVVQDLGGKHGTYVNDARLEMNCKIELPLQGGEEHVIRIGNAPLICRAIIPDAKLDELTQIQDESLSSAPTIHETASDNVTVYDDTTIDAPSTRESREAQIAAMVASMESDPVYKKYIPTDEENVIAESMTNLAADRNNNCTADNSSNNNTDANKYNLPISSSITLSPGSNSFTSSDGTNTPLQAKASVATLCFEPSGARLVAGHRDGTLRFYDFHGMQPTSNNQTTYPPFRIVDSDNDPLDSTGRHIITALGASAGGGQWIVGTTSAQPRVLDREGRTTLFHFIKGDIYVTDSSNTKGHTAPGELRFRLEGGDNIMIREDARFGGCAFSPPLPCPLLICLSVSPSSSLPNNTSSDSIPPPSPPPIPSIHPFIHPPKSRGWHFIHW